MRSRKQSVGIWLVFVFFSSLAMARPIVYWNNSTGDRKWTTPQNWEDRGSGGGTAGSTTETDTHIEGGRGIPCPIISTGDVCVALRLKGPGMYGGLGDLIINDGTITTGMEWYIGQELTDGPGKVYMSGGYVTVGSNAVFGNNGKAEIYMTGGTIEIKDNLYAVQNAGSFLLKLDGGLFTCNSIAAFNAAARADIGQGKFRINGNRVNQILGYRDQGRFTAYDGMGTLDVTYNSITNQTWVKAIHMLNPVPADESAISRGDLLLEWTLPDPNHVGAVVTCDVLFGTDPNVLNMDKIVDNQTVESAQVTVESGNMYYWQITIYQDGELNFVGPMFSFNTFNQPPIADAGVVDTWLVDNTPRQVQMNPTVTDDGYIQPLTYEWTVLEEPNDLNPAVILNPTVKNATVEMYEAGTYVLQLEVFDGEFTVSDTAQVTVFADACAHAIAQPGFQRLAGDNNMDCIVDLADFSELAQTWLMHNYSD